MSREQRTRETYDISLMNTTAWVNSILNLIAPRCCLACDEALAYSTDLSEESAVFCEACEPLLSKAPSSAQPPARDANLYLYRGPLAEAIQRFKYQGRTDVGLGLARFLAQEAKCYSGRIEWVVPLPLHRSQLRRRGFNQCTYFAKAIAHLIGAKFNPRCLVRCRPTISQTELRAADRERNPVDSFRTRRSFSCFPSILIVDDVRTTGATLAEASLALRRAGFEDVYTLALATASA